MAENVELPDTMAELPNARDALPNLHRAEMGKRKFSRYSLNLERPQNEGSPKAGGC